MGVHNLWDLLAPCGRRCSIDSLARKRLAVDASIWLIQFIKAMRDVETGEMLCSGETVLGDSEVPLHEAGYLFTPPCLWGNPADGLLPPPVLLSLLLQRSEQLAQGANQLAAAMNLKRMKTDDL